MREILAAENIWQKNIVENPSHGIDKYCKWAITVATFAAGFNALPICYAGNNTRSILRVL